jgi:hypothetical protein
LKQSDEVHLDPLDERRPAREGAKSRQPFDYVARREAVKRGEGRMQVGSAAGCSKNVAVRKKKGR